jgi:hypothetical protein
MKLDKKVILAAALITGLGFAASACSDDDDKDKKELTCDTAKNLVLNEAKDACVCKTGFTGDAKTGCTANAEVTCDDSKNLKKNAAGTACECKDGWQKANTTDESCTVEICGDGKVVGTEVCDWTESGSTKNYVFADGYNTCTKWAQLHSDSEDATATYTGTPGCSSTCKDLAKNTCDTGKCGNHDIDAGEKCDTDANGNIIFADSVTDRTCSATYGETAHLSTEDKAKLWSSGVPECNADCRGYKKGTCEGPLSGIVSCNLTAIEGRTDSNKVVKATASATLYDANTTVQGKILCGKKDEKISTLLSGNIVYSPATGVGNNASNELTVDTTAITTAGDYGCIVVLKAKDKNAVVCKPATSGYEVFEYGDAKVEDAFISNFTVTAQLSANSIAKWDFSNYANKTSEIKTALPNGIAPETGVNTLRLKWIVVDGKGSGIDIKMDADDYAVRNNDYTDAHKTALVFSKGSGNDNVIALWGTASAAESSHISIEDLSNYNVEGIKLKAKYQSTDGTTASKIYVSTVSGTTESTAVATSMQLANTFNDYEITINKNDIKAINIYGDNNSAKQLSIDDIEVIGTAKTPDASPTPDPNQQN